jgi:tape measure domain-containing protein
VSVVANVAINVDSSGAVSKLRQVQQGAQATQRATADLTTAITKQSGAFSKLQAGAAGAVRSLSGLRGALASIGAGALVAGMVRGAAAAEQLQLRLKLLSREYGETERVQQFVAQSARTFGQSQIEASAGVADVYARLRPLGTSLAQIETVYKGFNAVALASGTSAEAASGAFLQLSQALGSGRLQGDEFRSVAEQVPGILKLVSNEMGVTVGQLKQLGSDGKITSDILINALAKGFEENKDKIAELLALSPAQRFKEFKDSTQALSNAIGSELLPAIVPVVKVATELLRLFGQLPGPMKTIIAAAIGLTAAFVALAPAISTAISLLGGLSIATLAAAGPWIALAAGITAAVVALASYRSESEKIGAKAAAGDPAALAAARNRIASKQQEVSLLERQRPGPRSSRGGDLVNARRELAQLKRDVATGETAAVGNAVSTPIGATVGGTSATGPTGGKAGGADEAKRAADEALRESQRVADVIRDQQFITKQKGIQTKFAQLIFDAEQSGDPIRARQLQTVEALVLAGNETARLLEEEKNGVARLAIARTRQGEAEAIRQEGLQDVLKLQIAQQKNFDAIIADLDLQLKLKTATTEQEREQLRIAAERAKLEAQLKGQGFQQPQIDQITGLQAQIAAPLTDVQKIDQYIGKLKDEIADLTSISNIAITSAEGIGKAFAQSFQGLISGTMTAKEALGSFFKSVADMFLEMAAQIIAKQITMIILQTILKALGGAPGGGMGSSQFQAGSAPQMSPSLAGAQNYSSAFKARATGGPVSSQQPYLVGERGPELFMPNTGGSVVNNNDLRSAMGGRPGGANGSPVLSMSFQSTTINGVEYVSRDQLEAAMAQTRRQAAKEGASRGMNMTLDKIQNSPSTRSRVGIR